MEGCLIPLTSPTDEFNEEMVIDPKASPTDRGAQLSLLTTINVLHTLNRVTGIPSPITTPMAVPTPSLLTAPSSMLLSPFPSN